MVFSATLIVLLSGKLSISDFDFQKNKSFVGVLNNIGPSMDPWRIVNSNI